MQTSKYKYFSFFADNSVLAIAAVDTRTCYISIADEFLVSTDERN